MVFKKPNWGPPPENYIAGLGRGASGFVTRADYGTAKVGIATVGGQSVDLQGGQNSQIKQAPTAALRELTSLGKQPEKGEDYSDANYDEWSGYGGSLFTGAGDDAEDKEADMAFDKIDAAMDNRRKKKREEKLKEMEQKMQKEQKDYQAQFSDLKRQLVNITRAEWEALPDAPDLVKKSKKQRDSYQRYTPVPDSVIQSARMDNQAVNYIDPNQGSGSSLDTSGFASQINGGMQSVSNLTELGQARGQLLSIKLDKAQSESVISRTPALNKEGYMTDLNSLTFNSAHEINDIKKARALLKSVITNNPNSASGWIAAARVEELDGKIQQARNIMAQACQNFLDNEDIWLEASRLSPPDKTKALLAKAVSLMPKSKKLWLQASRKEQDIEIKKQILLKALEQIPSDIELWKETIQLANPDEAKSLLYKATENVPQSTELWLALAKLETYENARIVLNKAREKLPTEHSIWVNAAKLEEAQGNSQQVGKIVNRAIKRLVSSGLKIKRDQWLKEAVQAEESGSIVTCRAIIKETMYYGMDEFIEEQITDEKERKKQFKRIWIENAESCVSQSAIETARALYFNAIVELPDKKSLWFNAIKLEEQYGSKDNLKDILIRAKDATKHIFFYLKLAKHLWKQLNLAEEARQVLNEGYQNHSDSEDIILALQKFERENKNYKAAQAILDAARGTLANEKISMQSIQLQREIGNIDNALEQVNEGLQKYRGFYKLWLIKAQLLEQVNLIEDARKTYEEALQIDEVKIHRQIWLSFSELETNQEAFTRARTILQKARIRMPNDEQIWLASIRLEVKSDNIKIAQNLMSQALQKCPTSGKLWAQQIEMEPAATRKSQVMNALKNNDNDSDLFLAIAKVFWTERKGEKIKKWIQNAITLNKDNGDAWAHYLRYELEFGNEESQSQVLEKFLEADPHHGELWTKESKKVHNWRKNPKDVLRKVAMHIKLFNEI